jgi:hypothetical protein
LLVFWLILLLVLGVEGLDGCLDVATGVQLRVENFLDGTIFADDKCNTAREQTEHRLWHLVGVTEFLLLVRQNVKLKSLLGMEFLVAIYRVAAHSQNS